MANTIDGILDDILDISFDETAKITEDFLVKEHPKRDWSDTHLDQFSGVKLPMLYSEEDKLNVCRTWMMALKIGHIAALKLTIVVANLLRDPVTLKPVFEKGDQGPSPEEMGISKDMASLQQDIRIKFDKKHGKEEYEIFMTQVEGLPNEMSVAAYAFFAMILCRLLVKKPNSVMAHLRQRAISQLDSFYSKGLLSAQFPTIDSKVMEFISLNFQPGTTNGRAIMLPALKAFLRAKSSKNEKTTAVLLYTILLSTSFNGLQLVDLALKAYQRVRETNFDRFLTMVSSILTEKHSLYMIGDMWKNYISKESTELLYKWARVVDPKYFAYLSIPKNALLAVIFIAFIEDRAKGGAWNISGVKHVSPYEKEVIVTTVKIFKIKKAIK